MNFSLFGLIVRLTSLPRRVLMTAAVVLVALVAFTDWATGPDVSINVGYMIPVFVAAAGGRRASIVVTSLAAITWSTIELESRINPFSTAAVPLWNVFARFVVLYMVATLVASLTGRLVKERGLSRTDPLTGLPNARAFEEAATAEIARMRAEGTVLTAAYVDVDDFKRVNDTKGHAGGDELLILAGSTMTGTLRSTDVVARLGGDEFAVLMPGSGVADARQRLHALHAALTSATGVGYSVGAVTFTLPPESSQSLLARADKLMYEVKQQGKNTVRAEEALTSVDA
ncbi:GGDEF domain-containing protein [Actinoplanes sp. TBRC 11911]|uniref:GGDEF domain-containing protein n=1 Tax=Actinoplanes sp. TBRC 11911 TaxID=2729386 RepID=UPI00145E1C89|nr:GGDEF domain-containing protein [Actinoplanes sp. TBRC 11911]NMO55281.1 GGDEF domain-containing protein [Actinoplanes sp. TBRC 11911]